MGTSIQESELTFLLAGVAPAKTLPTLENTDPNTPLADRGPPALSLPAALSSPFFSSLTEAGSGDAV